MRYFLTGDASKYLENVQIKKMLLASVLRLGAAQKVDPGVWLLCKVHTE